MKKTPEILLEKFAKASYKGDRCRSIGEEEMMHVWYARAGAYGECIEHMGNSRPVCYVNASAGIVECFCNGETFEYDMSEV